MSLIGLIIILGSSYLTPGVRLDSALHTPGVLLGRYYHNFKF